MDSTKNTKKTEPVALTFDDIGRYSNGTVIEPRLSPLDDISAFASSISQDA
jgi:hypothetical protein